MDKVWVPMTWDDEDCEWRVTEGVFDSIASALVVLEQERVRHFHKLANKNDNRECYLREVKNVYRVRITGDDVFLVINGRNPGQEYECFQLKEVEVQHGQGLADLS